MGPEFYEDLKGDDGELNQHKSKSAKAQAEQVELEVATAKPGQDVGPDGNLEVGY